MEKVKNIALLLFLAVFIASLCLNVHHYTKREQEPYRDTIRTTFVDTIPYYKPVPKEEKPLGNITAKLPVSVPKFPENGKNLQDSVQDFGKSVPNDHFEDMGEKVTPDSADVVIPITQKVYEDSTYKAYVSGYKASLDSFYIYPQTKVITIREQPQRWHIGITAGYGVTAKGLEPYIGIGISYSIIAF